MKTEDYIFIQIPHQMPPQSCSGTRDEILSFLKEGKYGRKALVEYIYNEEDFFNSMGIIEEAEPEDLEVLKKLDFPVVKYSISDFDEAKYVPKSEFDEFEFYLEVESHDMNGTVLLTRDDFNDSLKKGGFTGHQGFKAWKLALTEAENLGWYAEIEEEYE